MPNTTYEFEEVPVTLPNGQVAYLAGEIEVDYAIHPAEPDVGIFRKYAECEFWSPFIVTGFLDDGDSADTFRLLVSPDDVTGRQIINAIDDDVEAFCCAEAEHARYYRRAA